MIPSPAEESARKKAELLETFATQIVALPPLVSTEQKLVAARYIVEQIILIATQEATERAAALIDDWNHASVLQLHAGEMTAGELRTTQAILKVIAQKIRESSHEII